MMPETIERRQLAGLRPAEIVGYLRATGWAETETKPNHSALWSYQTNGATAELLLPLRSEFKDYLPRITEAVDLLAAVEHRTRRAVLDDLLQPPADLLSFQEVSSDSETGTLPFDHAVRLINGTRKLLLSVAHSTLVPLAYHPRLSRSEAEVFVNRCRLGQTDRGSFIVNVACPLEEQLTFLDTEEPFARRVTSLLLDTLDTLARATEEGVTDDLIDPARHRGISANLCESLLMLRPSGDRASLTVSATWSRTRLPPSRLKSRRVELRQEVFAVAEALAPRLRTLPKPRSSRFYGFVEAILGQPTQADPRPSGETRFRLFDQEEEFLARADLCADDYAIAGAAHLAGDLVSFKGILHRLPRLNRIEQVAHFNRVRLDEDGIPEDVNSKEATTP